MGKDVVSQSATLKKDGWRKSADGTVLEARSDGPREAPKRRWTLGGECESDRDDWQEIRTVTCARSAARAVSASL